MVTRQQSTTKTPVHTRAYVPRAGATPSAIRAAQADRGMQAAQGIWPRAATDCKAALVNIDNRCKRRDLQRQLCS